MLACGGHARTRTCALWLGCALADERRLRESEGVSVSGGRRVQDTMDGTVRIRPPSRCGGGGEPLHFRTITAADMAAYADESDVPLITAAAAKGTARAQQPPIRPPSLRAVRTLPCPLARLSHVHARPVLSTSSHSHVVHELIEHLRAVRGQARAAAGSHNTRPQGRASAPQLRGTGVSPCCVL